MKRIRDVIKSALTNKIYLVASIIRLLYGLLISKEYILTTIISVALMYVFWLIFETIMYLIEIRKEMKNG